MGNMQLSLAQMVSRELSLNERRFINMIDTKVNKLTEGIDKLIYLNETQRGIFKTKLSNIMLKIDEFINPNFSKPSATVNISIYVKPIIKALNELQEEVENLEIEELEKLEKNDITEAAINKIKKEKERAAEFKKYVFDYYSQKLKKGGKRLYH